METSVDQTHPYSAFLDKVDCDFGGEFPPRSVFASWPAELQVFSRLADDLPEKLCSWNSPDVFRAWVRQTLEEEVDLEVVISAVTTLQGSSEDQGVLCGVYTAISHIVQAYRWGAIPVLPSEQRKSTLEFPPELWKPFAMISDHFGVEHRGSHFNLVYMNVLDNSDNENNGSDLNLRYVFNTSDDGQKAELNFFKCFTEMERTFQPVLELIRSYLNLSQRALMSEEAAEKVLPARLDALAAIKENFMQLGKVFRSYMLDQKVDPKMWARYVQPFMDWSVNGVGGGPSGSESMIFQCLDEFLAIPGKCVIYTEAFEKRRSFPAVYRDLLLSLKVDQEARFTSGLQEYVDDQENDPVVKARKDLVDQLHMWRLGHARVAKRKLEFSGGTASRTVDDLGDDGEHLSVRVEKQLLERARETSSAKRLPQAMQQSNLSCVIS